MSDAIDYCRDCQTNVLCHMERRCTKAHLMSHTPRTDEAIRKLPPALAKLARELERENTVLREWVEHHATHADDLIMQNAKLSRITRLAYAAVEAGAIDECYLSLLRNAIAGSEGAK